MSDQTTQTAGDLLRQGRLRQRLSILDCAKRTHISARYLEALEEERWNDLPSESHRLGFLRLYSRFLGVPSEEVLSLYRKSEESSNGKAKTAPFQTTPTKTKEPSTGWFPSSWPQLLGIIVLLLLTAWGVYHTFYKS